MFPRDSPARQSPAEEPGGLDAKELAQRWSHNAHPLAAELVLHKVRLVRTRCRAPIDPERFAINQKRAPAIGPLGAAGARESEFVRQSRRDECESEMFYGLWRGSLGPPALGMGNERVGAHDLGVRPSPRRKPDALVRGTPPCPRRGTRFRARYHARPSVTLLVIWRGCGPRERMSFEPGA